MQNQDFLRQVQSFLWPYRTQHSESKISWNKLGTVASSVRTNASEIQKPLHQDSDLSSEMRQGTIRSMGCIRQTGQPQVAHCSSKLLPKAQVDIRLRFSQRQSL